MEPSSFDPSLPSIRLLQTWIRERKILSLELTDGRRLIGMLIWLWLISSCQKELAFRAIWIHLFGKFWAYQFDEVIYLVRKF